MKNKSYFGIVEGFFSTPLKMWSWEERNKIFDFIEEYAPDINSYLYCPKDDELVTKKPYQLYSKKQLNSFKKFVTRCNKNRVKFIYGLNPSFSEAELIEIESLHKKTLLKLNQLISIGVKDICLLFDNIPMAYDVFEESASFSKETSSKIIELVNSVYKELKSKLNSFWFCSPDYNFKKETELTKAIKNLDKDIKLFWSGNEIFSKEKTIDDLERAKSISGSDNIIIWDNYPVNDAEQNIGCFNLGGFYPIDKQVLGKIGGIFVNPMREAFANLPFLITFSEYIKDSYRYSRDKSWLNALRKIEIPKRYFFMLQQFTTPNAFDSKTPSTEFIGASSNKILKILNSTSFSNEYTKLFLSSAKQLITEAKFYIALFEIVERKKQISLEYFRDIDQFPTKVNVPRYYTEVLKIIYRRYQVYSDKDIQKVLKSYFDLSDYFEAIYKGKARLSISTTDSRKIFESIDTIISDEQVEFVSYLNDDKIDLDEKKKAFFKRRYINRFSV